MSDEPAVARGKSMTMYVLRLVVLVAVLSVQVIGVAGARSSSEDSEELVVGALRSRLLQCADEDGPATLAGAWRSRHVGFATTSECPQYGDGDVPVTLWLYSSPRMERKGARWFEGADLGWMLIYRVGKTLHVGLQDIASPSGIQAFRKMMRTIEGSTKILDARKR